MKQEMNELSIETVGKLRPFAEHYEQVLGVERGHATLTSVVDKMHVWLPEAFRRTGLVVLPCPLCGATYPSRRAKSGVHVGKLSANTGGVKCDQCGVCVERWSLPPELQSIEDEQELSDYYEWWLGVVLGAVAIWNTRVTQINHEHPTA